jgi:hypothetical protein
MVAQSFKLLSPRFGREIAITYYFKAAERTVVSIGSMRVVASNREFGPPTLQPARHKFDFYSATTIFYISMRILHFRRNLTFRPLRNQPGRRSMVDVGPLAPGERGLTYSNDGCHSR